MLFWNEICELIDYQKLSLSFFYLKKKVIKIDIDCQIIDMIKICCCGSFYFVIKLHNVHRACKHPIKGVIDNKTKRIGQIIGTLCNHICILHYTIRLFHLTRHILTVFYSDIMHNYNTILFERSWQTGQYLFKYMTYNVLFFC